MANSLKTKKDLSKINRALVQDVKTATEFIRQNYDKDFYAVVSSAYRPDSITTSGKKSRHASGLALDVADFKGNTYSNNRDEFTKWGNIFVQVLEKMGYKRVKSEAGEPKTILWLNDKNHLNHVHISNTTQSTSPDLPKDFKIDDVADATQNIPSQGGATQYQTDTGLSSLFRFESKNKLTKKVILEALLNEGLFGKNEYETRKMIVVPAKYNDYVFFPFDDGKVIRTISTDCKNEITISFNDDTNKIQYCNAAKDYVYRGSKVKKDERVGRVGNDDVTIRILDDKNNLIAFKDLKIKQKTEKKQKEEPKTKSDNKGSQEKQTRKYVSATSIKYYEPDLLNPTLLKYIRQLKKMIGINKE